MSNQDQLPTVVTAFEHWRSNRNGRQVPTPLPLREQAVALLNYYSSRRARLKNFVIRVEKGMF